MSRLTSGLIAGLLLTSPLAALADDGGYTPPPLGLHLDMIYKDLDYGDNIRQDDTIVAIGEDFAIHRSRGYVSFFSTSVDWEDYYAEFAGYYVHFCSDELPSSETRQAAMDLWPLEPGKSVELGTDDYTWRYEVLEVSETNIGTEPKAVYIVKGTDLDDAEGYSETASISTEWNSYIGAKYDVWGEDFTTRAIVPERPFRMTDDIREQLGYCAALLDDAPAVQKIQKSQGE